MDHRSLTANMAVVDNPSERRFEVRLGDAVAFASYRLVDNLIVFTHTEVPVSLRRRGIANRLVRGALDSSRARGLKVRSECPYVTAFLQRHPDYRDLLAPG
ncbi:MAG: hypothetical protein MNPFHGCM_00506 [Gemmatimonadaceae bacterium]|nr:hypothetical protein [Gemmatimonadaceae bacterium]